MNSTEPVNPSPLEEDDEITAAMALLQQSFPRDDLNATEDVAKTLSDPLSPTLEALDINRRPALKTVCETCPNSMWFSSPLEVKCYCRVMYLVTWSTQDPNVITNCDGTFIGQE